MFTLTHDWAKLECKNVSLTINNQRFYSQTKFSQQIKFSLTNELNQGPLNIWTEHSNCQIHSRGDLKNLVALLIPNIFLIFTDEKKAEGMTKFDIFHVFVENSVNSEFCLF